MTTTQDNLPALEACPFCGSGALLHEIDAHTHAPDGIAGFMPDYPGSFTIECTNDECNCGMIAMEPDGCKKVIAAWNRRAAIAAQGEQQQDAERYRKMRAWCIADCVPGDVCDATTAAQLDHAIDSAIVSGEVQS